MASILEQYRISDFLEWHREKRILLNPDFQRGSVWTPAARTYLIDTILRQLPVPKIYMRTKIDVGTKKSIREVVDGQQRLRAIIDFADDQFALSKRAEEFAGKRYSSLGAELQETFLSYAISVDQLINATDDDVLEVFARLNSYNVKLNPPELRHAKYQGEFKWAVRKKSREWLILWDKYHLVPVKQRVRMLDDSLIAEMLGILLEGVKDGGQKNINRLYDRQDENFDPAHSALKTLDKVIEFFDKELGDYLIDTPLTSAPHFLMLFAALAHALYGIPEGQIDEIPLRDDRALKDLTVVKNNLLQLASVIDSDVPVSSYEKFWLASTRATPSIASRRERFPVFYKALLPETI